MRIISSLLLLTLFISAALAQTGARVSGTLVENGNPVGNEKIVLITPDGILSTKTDEDGKYTFESVADGKYVLSHGGRNAAVTVVNGVITISKFGEVVVVATGTTQPLSNTAKSVSVIENREVRERNEISLADALSTIPGFRVQQLGGFGRTATIKTRGLRNHDTAILIDGFRLRDPAAITGDASPFISDFSLANVSRIEVLRGSGSSIYGTNAIGGVVDFQTPEPKSGFHGGLVGEYGGMGLKRVRGNIGDGTKDGKFGFNTGLSRIVFSEGIDGEDDAHNTNFQGRVDYNPLLKTNISGRVFLSDAFVRLNGNPDTVGALPAITQIIDAEEGINFSTDAN
ncbi:MAG: TonB-dependent receptor plug domain-containing protein, partial [Pyrinomonadaceae bacterium]|nr:TonB-dependent receptor plug domain-containing protein [Pyrinomonadaceae bacterium]